MEKREARPNKISGRTLGVFAAILVSLSITACTSERPVAAVPTVPVSPVVTPVIEFDLNQEYQPPVEAPMRVWIVVDGRKMRVWGYVGYIGTDSEYTKWIEATKKERGSDDTIYIALVSTKDQIPVLLTLGGFAYKSPMWVLNIKWFESSGKNPDIQTDYPDDFQGIPVEDWERVRDHIIGGETVYWANTSANLSRVKGAVLFCPWFTGGDIYED